jgi:hypothetical protein
MNREDIIRTAREAECEETWGMDAFRFSVEELERFFRLAYEAGAKDEREACAIAGGAAADAGLDVAAAIRARSKE